MLGEQRHRHARIGDALEIISAVSRWPKGLSCVPACQIETFSALQVSTGPTVIACVGTSAMLPPPLVRAFCAMVSGCRSTTRVASWRYSAAEGGASLYLPAPGQRIVEGPMLHVALPALHDRAAHAGVPASRGRPRVSALGKCRCASGMRQLLVDAVESTARGPRAQRKADASRASPRPSPVEPFVHAPEMRRRAHQARAH